MRCSGRRGSGPASPSKARTRTPSAGSSRPGWASASCRPAALAPGAASHALRRDDTAGLGWVEIALDSGLAFREIGLAWRERRGGADAEPDPVRLFRELVLSEGPALLAGFVRERSGS